MFSISAIAIAASSGTWRMIAGISARPAMLRGAPAALAGDDLVALRRRPASGAPSGRTTIGCTTPCALIESASSVERLGAHVDARLVAARAAADRAAGCASSSPRRGRAADAGGRRAAERPRPAGAHVASPEQGRPGRAPERAVCASACVIARRDASDRAPRSRAVVLAADHLARPAPGRPARRATPCRGTAPACRRTAPRPGARCAG